MRKYLLNFGVITSIGGAIGLLQATKNGPRDWRLLLMWASWIISVALAVGVVSQNADDVKRDQQERLAEAVKKRR